MKKLALLIGLMLSFGSSLMAQSTVETVYLKNGGLVKGEIIEQVPGQSLKVKTKDGNIFVYQMDEVERIAKEQATNIVAGHRGLDFDIDFGYNIPTKSGIDGTLAVGLNFGKRFSKNFYWGIGASTYIPTKTPSSKELLIPITTEVKLYFPITNTKITPYVSLKGGYVINTNDDIRRYVNRKNLIIKKSNFGLIQIMPGLSFPLSGCIDFNLAAGYTHLFAVSGDSDDWGAIAIRAGFSFHKSVKKARHNQLK